MQSEQINELVKALVKVQSRLQAVEKDAENPHFRSKYSTLSASWDACRELLSENGLAVIQTTEVEPSPVLVTTLFHVSGQWIRGEYPLNPVKNDPQSLAGAVSYSRRYSLQAIVGLSSKDDDGEDAMNRDNKDKGKESLKPGVHGNKILTNVALEDYRIPFGTNKDKSLWDVPVGDLLRLCDWLEKKAKSEKKPVSGAGKEYIERVEEFIKQNGKQQDIESDPFPFENQH